MKKKLIGVLLMLCMLLPGAFAVDLYVDGSALQTDVQPAIISGRTLVRSVRFLKRWTRRCNGTVPPRTALAQKDGTSVRVTINSTTAYVNGQAYTLDVPAQLISRAPWCRRGLSPNRCTRVCCGTAARRASYILTENHEPLAVDYLDVGQADSILLSSGGEYMLIDAGNNADGDDVVNYLRQAGVTQLKYAVGTHAHEDHIGGMDDVIDAFLVQQVLLPDATTNTQTYRDLLDAIERSGVPVAVPQRGDTYSLGDTQITVIAAQAADDLNNTSIVLKAVYGEASFLFMGDAETAVENAILATGTDIDCDVLKVGHHGSDTSTGSAFLAAVSPQAAVICCGAGNSYGHPSPSTLSRLDGIPVWRTDLNGTVVAMTDGNSIHIMADRGTAATTAPSAPQTPSSPAPDPGSGETTDSPVPDIPSVVYITPTGKRYHYSSDCAGKNASAVHLAAGACKRLKPLPDMRRLNIITQNSPAAAAAGHIFAQKI